jgi:two-component system, OmpR family, sensor histidine kinase KdpD
LRQRIHHGNVYPPERAEQALHQFFREGNLNALREMALRKVSASVEQDLEEYMREHAIDAVWPAAERVMVCVDANPHSQDLLRRGWRRATRQQSDLLAVFVQTPGWEQASENERRSLEDNLRFASDLGASVLRVQGSNVAQELARVARDRNAGDIVIGHSQRGRMRKILRESTVNRLLRLLPNTDIHVVADRPRD